MYLWPLFRVCNTTSLLCAFHWDTDSSQEKEEAEEEEEEEEEEANVSIIVVFWNTIRYNFVNDIINDNY